MEARHWLRAALLLAFAALAAPAHGQTRRALVVGIDAYEPSSWPQSAQSRSWKNLKGSTNDAEAMSLLLRRKFGFRSENVLVLKNEKASREGILSAFRTHLVEAAATGDVCLFFYAGHGSQIQHHASKEQDRKDETLVPADWHRGAPDIRDKELTVLFNDVLDRGARLNIILDSCHSTSMQRGVAPSRTVRSMGSDPKGVAGQVTPDPRGDPAERGALVMTAAQDFQNATEIEDGSGTSHGVFTFALLQALQAAPVDEPVEDLFSRVRAVVRSGGYAQEPSLLGEPGRRAAPLFGAPRGEESRSVSVAVLEVDGKRCTIEGGRALGLHPGTILNRVGAPEAEPLRVEITELSGINRAIAQAIGTPKALHAGDLFEVERWAAPNEAFLRVAISGSPWSEAELQAKVKELVRRPNFRTVRWVSDPTEQTPAEVLTLGVPIQNVASPAFVNVPVPSKLAGDLRLDVEALGGALEVVEDPSHAHYVLVGRWTGRRIEYAWVLPDATTRLLGGTSPLPVRSDWVPVTTPEETKRQLLTMAMRLAKVRGWLQLEPPPDTGRFPYRLVLRNQQTKTSLWKDGTMSEGDRVDPILSAEASELERGFEQRYIYVFVIDSSGKITTLYPRGGGNFENYVPARSTNSTTPVEIMLTGATFEVGPPFGLDTYVLLSTRKPLPSTSILEGVPINLRGNDVDPLTRLLNAMATGRTRAIGGIATQADWSLRRISMRSIRRDGSK